MAKYATLGRIEAVWNKLGGEEGVDRFLRGEIAVQPAVIDTMLDPIIRTNQVSLVYPRWMKRVLHPDLEQSGPTEYRANNLRPDPERARVESCLIYKDLVANDQLRTCLGLVDLLAIQAKGLDFYRKHFKDEVIAGWKSVVENSINCPYVPYVCETPEKVALGWMSLRCAWLSDTPAVRFHM